MSVSTLLRKKTRQIANAKKCDGHLTSFYTKYVHKLEKLTLHLELVIMHQFTLVAIVQIRIFFYLVSCAVMRFVGQATVKRLGVSIK